MTERTINNMRYKCIKRFSIDVYAPKDGTFLFSSAILVGSVWKASELDKRMIEKKDFIHLDLIDDGPENGRWIEISKETLQEHFELTKDDAVTEHLKYISTNTDAMTVGQMIEVLKTQDQEALVYIKDDNDEMRPVYDIGTEDRKIIICDF